MVTGRGEGNVPAGPTPGSRRRRGVVLVDVIVATVILASGLAAVVGLAYSALRGQARGRELVVAAMLLDEHLNMVLARGPDDYDRRFDTSGACDAPYEDYSYSIDISGGEGGDAYLVRVTVSWPASAGVRSESVETLIAPRLGDEADPVRRPDTVVEREE